MALWPLEQATRLLLVAVFAGGADPRAIGYFLAFSAVTVAVSVVRWSRFTWTVEAGTLVIEQGLLQRSRRVIPADRVQSVDLVRPLRHRLLGVVQVRVEAIGGGDSEGRLSALDMPTALTLQHALIGAREAARRAREARAGAAADGVDGVDGGTHGAGADGATDGAADGTAGGGAADGTAGGGAWADGAGGGPGAVPMAPSGPVPGLAGPPRPPGLPAPGSEGPAWPGGAAHGPEVREHLRAGPAPAGPRPVGSPRVVAAVTPGSLVVAGLTGGRVGILAVLIGGAQQVVGDRLDEALALAPTDLGVLATVLIVAGLAALVFVGSVIATVISYWGFTATRDASELRISRGLLEQRLETVPIRRIQSLRIEQNLLRKAVGMASVKADLAGRAGGGDPGTGLLLPIGPLADAQRLVADLLGAQGPVMAELEPAPPRSRRRYLVKGLLLGLTAAVPITPAAALGLVPAWWPLAAGLAVAAVGVPLRLAEWQALGHASVEGVLVSRTGAIVRRRVHVPVGRVQQLSLRASPFQRRLSLVDVVVGIARSGGWEGPRLPEMDAEEARLLVAVTAHDAVEASRRPRSPRPGTPGPRLPRPAAPLPPGDPSRPGSRPAGGAGGHDDAPGRGPGAS